MSGPRTPRAAFGAAPPDVALLPRHTVTESSHQMEDQAKREKQLQKLKAQVTPLCCPLTTPGPFQAQPSPNLRQRSSLPCLATPALVSHRGISETQGVTLEPQ